VFAYETIKPKPVALGLLSSNLTGGFPWWLLYNDYCR